MKSNDILNDAAIAQRKKLMQEDAGADITLLEKEWARYKYLILAKNPNGYKAIRRLLKDKSAYPVHEFYEIVDEALSHRETPGYEKNAAQHVFGYFKKLAAPEEKREIISSIESYIAGETDLARVKSGLYALAKKYNVKYLLESYYFPDI